MKKIIHLSDLHVGSDELMIKFGDIVTRMIFHKTPPKNYVVVITGDLVDDATVPGSYEEALIHINRLKNAGFTILPVPGNHDYGSGSLGYRDYVGIFKQAFYGDATLTYPKLDIIDEVAFIGLDSMADELNWYDFLFAQGELGKDQLNRLKTILRKDEVKKSKHRVVYLHHHPFHPTFCHQLKDSDKLGECLEGAKIDALLFGHNHDGRIWNGHWGIERAYDAGSSTSKGGDACAHRVIDFKKKPPFDYDAEF